MRMRYVKHRRPPGLFIIGVALIAMGAGMLLVIIIPQFAFFLAVLLVLIGLCAIFL